MAFQDLENGAATHGVRNSNDSHYGNISAYSKSARENGEIPSNEYIEAKKRDKQFKQEIKELSHYVKLLQFITLLGTLGATITCILTISWPLFLNYTILTAAVLFVICCRENVCESGTVAPYELLLWVSIWFFWIFYSFLNFSLSDNLELFDSYTTHTMLTIVFFVCTPLYFTTVNPRQMEKPLVTNTLVVILSSIAFIPFEDNNIFFSLLWACLRCCSAAVLYAVIIVYYGITHKELGLGTRSSLTNMYLQSLYIFFGQSSVFLTCFAIHFFVYFIVALNIIYSYKKRKSEQAAIFMENMKIKETAQLASLASKQNQQNFNRTSTIAPITSTISTPASIMTSNVNTLNFQSGANSKTQFVSPLNKTHESGNDEKTFNDNSKINALSVGGGGLRLGNQNTQLDTKKRKHTQQKTSDLLNGGPTSAHNEDVLIMGPSSGQASAPKKSSLNSQTAPKSNLRPTPNYFNGIESEIDFHSGYTQAVPKEGDTFLSPAVSFTPSPSGIKSIEVPHHSGDNSED